MRKVLVFGTFDIVHPGHMFLLRKAREGGNYVTAVIARDKNVRKIKGHPPINKEQKRIEVLRSTHLVHAAILGDLDDPLKILEKYRPDIIYLGYDQKHFVPELEAYLKRKKMKTKILRVAAYKPRIYHGARFRRGLPMEMCA